MIIPNKNIELIKKVLNKSHPKYLGWCFYNANKAAKPIPSTKAAAMSITV